MPLVSTPVLAQECHPARWTPQKMSVARTKPMHSLKDTAGLSVGKKAYGRAEDKL